MNKKIRYAVVGLGPIAQTAVLPAFKHAENSQLAALVTGNPEKNRELSACRESR
jgi:glucose-fructose oxidoreductase